LYLTVERPHHEGLEARIANAIAPTIEHMGYELVRVQVSGKERPVVQIMADRADGAAFRVEDCEAISHAVGAVLDVEDPIKNEWALEVSSAGIDRPLTRAKDWNSYAGHLANLELTVPQDGRKKFRGIALGADAETARMKLEDGTELVVARGNIRRARLILTDALIAATVAAAGLPDQDGADLDGDDQDEADQDGAVPDGDDPSDIDAADAEASAKPTPATRN
jgi:ribosome maturation factor RimP